MKILKGIIALFVITVALNTNVMGYFEINKYDIDATLMKNGDLYVEENIQYSTNETRNGVYRDINIGNNENKLNSASSLELYEVLVDNIRYMQVNTANNGQEGVYEYASDNGNKFKIKVFAPFENVGRTVKYKYVLKDVAVKYNDVGDLYWNFVGKTWEDDIKNLNIKITLMGDMGPNDVYVFGHGADNGSFKKLENNIILLSAQNITPGQAIDARIVFPNTAISDSNKIVDKDGLEKIINEEKRKENLAQNLIKTKEAVNKSQKQIVLGSVIFSLLLIIYTYYKYDKEKVARIEYFRDIPDNLEPAILGNIYNGKSNGRHFWATFFDLVRKKVYKIEKVTRENNKEEYIVKYIEKNKDIVLKYFEEETVECINKCIDGKDQIEFTSLNKKVRARMQTTKSFIDWESDVKKQKENIIEKPKEASKGIKWLTGINVVITIGILIIFALFSSQPEMIMFVVMFYGITTLAYTLFIRSFERNTHFVELLFFAVHFVGFQFALYAIAYNINAPYMYLAYLIAFFGFNYALKAMKHSDKEIDITCKLKGLKRYITDFSRLNEKDIEYINLWEQYLVMAIMFGVPKKILKRLCENLDTNVSDENFIAMSYMSNYTMFNSMNSQFNSSSYVSPYSGSGGGFSGGGSSGGGGRWWPEAAEVSKIK